MTTIAIIGAGAMGAGIGALLVGNGCTVLSPLSRRTAASRERALAAGMIDADLDAIGQADMILSIVPPARAADVVETLAPVFGQSDTPLFCDANAVAPQTKHAMAARVADLGGLMVDGSIIGLPPGGGRPSPRFYLSGAGAQTIASLRNVGLDTRVLDGPLGAASALKMCYAGINKGVIALVTAQLLAAQRHGASEDLLAELAGSHGQLLETMRKAIPRAYPKAWRWHPEMLEIASFLEGDDPQAGEIWAAIGQFYDCRAQAQARGDDCEGLKSLLS